MFERARSFCKLHWTSDAFCSFANLHAFVPPLPPRSPPPLLPIFLSPPVSGCARPQCPPPGSALPPAPATPFRAGRVARPLRVGFSRDLFARSCIFFERRTARASPFLADRLRFVLAHRRSPLVALAATRAGDCWGAKQTSWCVVGFSGMRLAFRDARRAHLQA